MTKKTLQLSIFHGSSMFEMIITTEFFFVKQKKMKNEKCNANYRRTKRIRLKSEKKKKIVGKHSNNNDGKIVHE